MVRAPADWELLNQPANQAGCRIYCITTEFPEMNALRLFEYDYCVSLIAVLIQITAVTQCCVQWKSLFKFNRFLSLLDFKPGTTSPGDQH